MDVFAPNNYLLSELNDQGQLVGLDERQEVFFGELSIKSIASFIKLKMKDRNIEL